MAVTDPTGRVFSFEWDARGNLTAAQGPGAAPVTLTWDGDDRLRALASGAERVSFEWNEASRPTRVTSAAGVATAIRWRADGLPDAVVDGTGAQDHFRYDDRGHLASGTDPLGATTEVVFDAAGRPVSETHPEGGRTRFDWDRADRLMAVTDAAGGTTRYRYDRAGLLVAATDPMGRTTRYRYEGRGLLEAVTDPLGRETTFTYDPCGRLTGRRDARGVAVSLRYDPAGRLVAVEAPGAVPVTYTWDAAGRLVGMVDETGETTWELDEAGRPAVEHRPGRVDLTHGYDPLGRRRRLQVHRAGTLLAAWDYDTDGDGRITAVTDHTGRRHQLGYDPAGRPSRIRYPNGVAATWTHDPAGQPVALEVTHGAALLAEWRAFYDGDGNRLHDRHRNGVADSPREVAYAYDSLGRLTSASDGVPMAYTWDAAHNRTAAGGEAAEFDGADQITTDGRHAYRHDDAGNLLTRTPGEGAEPDLACTYDPLGRTTAVTAAGATARFAYDGLGRRAVRHDDAGRTFRVFDGHHVVAEIGPDGRVDLETTAGLLVLARHGPASGAYLHPDLNTDVAVVTDDTGAVTARYDYLPFGERTVVAGDPDAAGPLGFCGTLGVRAELGGLLDMRARLYDPATGRFTTPDPWPAHLPEPITLNRYLYALGDPVSQVDPYGLFCLTGKNDQGKCRGIRDVAERVSKPLGVVSTVSTGVAAVMAGVTVVCPLPCGPITGPAAAVFQGVAVGARVAATASGVATTLSECLGSGPLSFSCVTSTASGAVSGVAGFGLKAGSRSLGLTDELRSFAGYTYGLLLGGAGHASERMSRK